MTAEGWEKHKARERARYRAKAADPAWRRKEQERSERYMHSKLRFLHGVKFTLGCIDCGTTEGRLDFDHRPGTIKSFRLSNARFSWERTLAEIDKCDVRCARCHGLRHGAEKIKIPDEEIRRLVLSRVPYAQIRQLGASSRRITRIRKQLGFGHRERLAKEKV
jgi:hypothetical protein